jgi:hypothetical protein
MDGVEQLFEGRDLTGRAIVSARRQGTTCRGRCGFTWGERAVDCGFLRQRR